MSIRAYLSNLSRAWPIERQTALLAQHVPGWPDVPTYTDVLKAKQRQAHSPAALVERGQMLRPTKRGEADTIYVASLAVLAWDGADFETALSGIWAKGAQITALDVGITIAPFDNDTARETFRISRKRAAVEARQKAGSAVSAANRRAAANAKAEPARPYWHLPSSEWPGWKLCEMTGLSYNTLIDRFGGREKAQARYQRNLKRKQQREQA